MKKVLAVFGLIVSTDLLAYAFSAVVAFGTELIFNTGFGFYDGMYTFIESKKVLSLSLWSDDTIGSIIAVVFGVLMTAICVYSGNRSYSILKGTNK